MYRTLQNTTEHCRTFFQNISQNTEQGFAKMISLSCPSSYATNRHCLALSQRLTTRPPLGIFCRFLPRERNLKYSRAFPYVGAQRLGMLRPSQREPTQRVSFARICNPSSNAQLWRTSTVASGFYPVLSYSTEHHTCRCCRTHDWRRGPVRNQRTGHSWLHTDADAARGGHRHADAGATWGGHRHADVGAAWGDWRHADRRSLG